MATFARTCSAQEGAHSLGNTSLPPDDFTKVFWSHVQFQHQRIAVVAHLTYLHGSRVVYQRLSDVLNQFTHISSRPRFQTIIRLALMSRPAALWRQPSSARNAPAFLCAGARKRQTRSAVHHSSASPVPSLHQE